MDDRSFDLIMARLDAQDEKLDKLLKDVERLKGRASLWGAVTGAMTALAANFIGGQ